MCVGEQALPCVRACTCVHTENWTQASRCLYPLNNLIGPDLCISVCSPHINSTIEFTPHDYSHRCLFLKSIHFFKEKLYIYQKKKQHKTNNKTEKEGGEMLRIPASSTYLTVQLWQVMNLYGHVLVTHIL